MILTEDEVKQNYSYYRDILKEYSPSVLTYVDDFSIDYPKDLVATLMSLELKKKFKMDKKIVILDATTVGLSSNEIYVLSNITDGTVRKIDFNVFKKEVAKNALDSGLLEVRHDWYKDVINRLVFLVVFYAAVHILFALLLVFDFGFSESIFSIIPVLFIFLFQTLIKLFPVVAIIYLVVFTLNLRKYPYKKTEKGNEVHRKLEGLKNFLKDFGRLDEKTVSKEDLIIWEEYLIYSVIFNQNKKLVKNILSIIK